MIRKHHPKLNNAPYINMSALFKYTLILLGGMLAQTSIYGAIYTVSPHGNDSNPGTAEAPFKSISKATAVLHPGDICHIQPGTYRERIILKSSGTEENPIQIIGATHPDGSPAVLFNGTDPVNGKWEKEQLNGIQALAIPCPETITQLFFKGRMMTEARWPDQRFDQIWDRTTWTRSEKGSKKDLMVCSALAETRADWTGAMATLNVGHQFKT